VKRARFPPEPNRCDLNLQLIVSSEKRLVKRFFLNGLEKKNEHSASAKKGHFKISPTLMIGNQKVEFGEVL